jgi:hypothetical protein
MAIVFKLDDEDENVEIIRNLNNLYISLNQRIINPHLKKLVKEQSYIAGGCIRALINKEKVNDYDFFFLTEDAAKEFSETIKNALTLKTIPFTNQEFLNFKSQTKNAITFELKYQDNIVIVQFIIKYSGSISTILQQFDFSICQNSYNPRIGKLRIASINDIKTKQLIFNNDCVNVLGAATRLVKFIKLGYIPNEKSILLLSHKIGNLSNVELDSALNNANSGISLDY